MSKQSFTPGPWSFRSYEPDGPLEDEVHSESPDAGDGDIVCLSPIHGGYDESAERWEANAHLIAAAPDLLAAAELALANLRRNLASEEVCGQPFMGDDEHEAISVLTAAISKATGAA